MSTNSSPGATQPVTTNRKVALLSGKQTLAAHSAMSRMKKAAAELRDQSTPLGKALYAEKRLIEALDKYILAKSDAAKAWSNYMQQEKNSAIKALYQNICELDDTWVTLHQRYRPQLPEQRRLFKQLLSGEHELARLQKIATSTAARSTKLGKQLDDNLKTRSKTLDMKKVETLEAELSKAVEEDKVAQRKYVLAVENHNKFKHREVKKVVSNLAEGESELYRDIWKMAEVKSQICKLYMDPAYNKDLDSHVHRAANESRKLMNGLYQALGVAVVAESEQSRPVQPAVIQYHVDYPHRNTVLPSAPPQNELQQSEDVSEDSEQCYRAIPEVDSDNEEYDANYIYEFDDNDFSDEDEFYENVEQSQERKYLELIEESSIETTPAAEQQVVNQDPEEDIFGTIASLNLRPRSAAELSGMTSSDQDDYGRIWQYGSRQNNNNIRSSSNNNHIQSDGASVGGNINYSSNNNNPDSEPPLVAGSGAQNTDKEIRYVKYPGSIGDKPAGVKSMVSELEDVFRQRFEEFKEQKRMKRKAPSPPPRTKGLTN